MSRCVVVCLSGMFLIHRFNRLLTVCSQVFNYTAGPALNWSKRARFHNNIRSVTIQKQVPLRPDWQQSTVELYLSGLIGTESHSDMQNIRTIQFLFENRLHWQFEVRLLLLII